MRRSFLPSVVLVLGLLAVCAPSATGAGAPGSLDPSFGDGGIVTTDVGHGPDIGRALALLPDGRTVVVGGVVPMPRTGLALAVFDDAGALDPSFGEDGTVVMPLGIARWHATADAVVAQPDGAIVVAGTDFDRFVVARFRPGGALDPDFGDDGVATVFRGTGEARAVVLQPSGRIVAGGRSDSAFALAGFSPEGTLDPSFGVNGKVGTPVGVGSEIRALVSLADGRLVAAGDAREPEGTELALARYAADGALDPSFGDGGLVTMSACDGGTLLRALALDPSGRLVVAGTCDHRSRFLLARFLPDGALDPSFGDGGITVTDVGSDTRDVAYSVAIDPSGKIVVAGRARRRTADWVVARYTANGALDPQFADGGVLRLPLGTETEAARAVAVHPDGGILVAGTAETDSAHLGLMRLDDGGALVPTFGVEGVTTADVGGVDDGAYAVALQPDGKIVTAGWTQCGSIALTRYETSGALDPTFGGDGKVVTDMALVAEATAIALTPDGRIVVVGDGGGPCWDWAAAFEIARYLPDGNLDPSFGGDGMVVTRADHLWSASSAVLRDDGTLVAGGGEIGWFVLARYLSDGLLDPSFGDHGIVTTRVPDGELLAMVEQPGGRVVAAGWSAHGFTLARYTEVGVLDPTFGDAGIATTRFTRNGEHGASALAVQPDGRLVAAGRAGAEPDCTIALARYTEDGTLDPTFGGDGKVRTDLGDDACERASEVRVLPDGRIVVAGGAGRSGQEDVVLVRYLSDGALDTTFGVGGVAMAPTTPEFEWAYGLVIQPDGKLVAAGVGSSPSDILVMRFEG